MIQSVHITNFQSHKDTTIELCPGVNIFTGSSDSGKSAIIRALRWNVLNLPRGERFRSKGGGDTEVMIWFDEGEDVSRIRSSKFNGYQHETMAWKALVSGVPEEVSQLLQMSEVNFQLQHDPAFMIAQSTPDLARFLNNIVGLELIDGVSSYAHGKKLQEQERCKLVRESIEKLEEEKKALDGAVKDGETVDALDDKLQELKAVQERQEKVRYHITNLAQIATDLQEFADIEEDKKRVYHLVMLADRLKSFITRGMTLKTTILELKDVYEGLSAIPTVDRSVLEGLLAKIQKYNAILERELVVRKNVLELEAADSNLSAVTKALDLSRNELRRIMPAVCPLCGGATAKKE